MSTPTIESTAKSLTLTAESVTPAAAQSAMKPYMDNLKDWSDLAQNQVQAVQTAVTEAVEAFKNVKAPNEAIDVTQTLAQSRIALTAKLLQEATVLSMAQFNAHIDSVQAQLPAPSLFVGAANGMKAAAALAENAMRLTLKSMLAPAQKTPEKLHAV